MAGSPLSASPAPGSLTVSKRRTGSEIRRDEAEEAQSWEDRQLVGPRARRTWGSPHHRLGPAPARPDAPAAEQTTVHGRQGRRLGISSLGCAAPVRCGPPSVSSGACETRLTDPGQWTPWSHGLKRSRRASSR